MLHNVAMSLYNRLIEGQVFAGQETRLLTPSLSLKVPIEDLFSRVAGRGKQLWHSFSPPALE